MLIGIVMYIIAMVSPSKRAFNIGCGIQWTLIGISLLLSISPDIRLKEGYIGAVIFFAIFTVIAYFVTYRRQDNIETKIYMYKKAAREKRKQMWICQRCGASNKNTNERCCRCNAAVDIKTEEMKEQ